MVVYLRRLRLRLGIALFLAPCDIRFHFALAFLRLRFAAARCLALTIFFLAEKKRNHDQE